MLSRINRLLLATALMTSLAHASGSGVQHRDCAIALDDSGSCVPVLGT